MTYEILFARKMDTWDNIKEVKFSTFQLSIFGPEAFQVFAFLVKDLDSDVGFKANFRCMHPKQF
jgi:hypothetical protein